MMGDVRVVRAVPYDYRLFVDHHDHHHDHDGALMVMINDHDNNQHDDNADKQLVMISSLFDRLVSAFQSHVDAFE